MPGLSNCVFCNLHKTNNKILFKNKCFFVTDNINPITKGHLLVISAKHIRSENAIPQSQNKAYLEASGFSYRYFLDKFNKEPMIFINAPQDQSVFHFHKHYILGIFGKLGVETALKNYLL